MLREESVGPALMVVEVSSEARALFLLAQDRAQPSSDEAIQGAELGWHDILEVAKPPSKHGIEVGDDPPQAHAPASSRRGAHLVPRFRRGQALERVPALLAHEAVAGLEPVAQEVEPLARLSAVSDASCPGGARGRFP